MIVHIYITKNKNKQSMTINKTLGVYEWFPPLVFAGNASAEYLTNPNEKPLKEKEKEKRLNFSNYYSCSVHNLWKKPSALNSKTQSNFILTLYSHMYFLFRLG